MATSEHFDMSPQHQEWLRRNNADATGNVADLQTYATNLGVTLGDNPHMYLNSGVHLPHAGSKMIIDWLPAKGETLELPRHQLELTSAVGKALLGVKQEAQRRATNFWGAVTMATGAAVWCG